MKHPALFSIIAAALVASCTSGSSDQSKKGKFAWKGIPGVSETVPHFGCPSAGIPQSGKAATKLVPLHLQLPWFANGEYSYAYLGKNLGIFKFHGFDVTISNGKGSDVAARALAAGSADAAIIGGDALVLVNQEGGYLRSLGAVYEETPVVIYSLAEKNIIKPTDLYGKRLGLMPGSNTFTQYNGWANIASAGLNGTPLPFDRKRVKEVIVQPASAPAMITNPVGDNALDALVHYVQFAPLQAEIDGEKIGRPVRFNKIRLSELNVKIYGMLLAVREGKFDDDQLYQLKAAIYDSFMCGMANRTASIDALAEANPDKPFGPGGSERLYASKQLDMMIKMACKDRGAKCEEFLSQKDDYWSATEDTLINFKLLKEKQKLDTLRIKLD